MSARRLLISIAMAGLVAGGAVAPAAADFYAGLRAYEARDYETARRHWTADANGGDIKAQFQLGRMHERGEGVPRDPVQAYKWYSLAHKGGNGDAGLAAHFLKQKMSPQQLAQAEQLVANFRPGAAPPATAQPPAAQPPAGPSAAAPPAAPPRVAVPRTAPPAATPPAAPGLDLAGTEIRFTHREGAWLVDELWRFLPGGRLVGVRSMSRGSSANLSEDRQENDGGTWAMEGGALCLQFGSWYGGKRCFQLNGAPGADIQLADMSSGRSYPAKHLR